MWEAESLVDSAWGQVDCFRGLALQLALGRSPQASEGGKEGEEGQLRSWLGRNFGGPGGVWGRGRKEKHVFLNALQGSHVI